MGITDFIGNVESRAAKFNKLVDRKTDKERRFLETKLLVPEELPSYTGPTPQFGTLGERTVKLVFDSKLDVDLLRKYFKVSEYQGLNVRGSNLVLLLVVLRALENGSLIYEKEELFFVDAEGTRFQL